MMMITVLMMIQYLLQCREAAWLSRLCATVQRLIMRSRDFSRHYSGTYTCQKLRTPSPIRCGIHFVAKHAQSIGIIRRTHLMIPTTAHVIAYTDILLRKVAYYSSRCVCLSASDVALSEITLISLAASDEARRPWGNPRHRHPRALCQCQETLGQGSGWLVWLLGGPHRCRGGHTTACRRRQA